MSLDPQNRRHFYMWTSVVNFWPRVDLRKSCCSECDSRSFQVWAGLSIIILINHHHHCHQSSSSSSSIIIIIVNNNIINHHPHQASPNHPSGSTVTSAVAVRKNLLCFLALDQFSAELAEAKRRWTDGLLWDRKVSSPGLGQVLIWSTLVKETTAVSYHPILVSKWRNWTLSWVSPWRSDQGLDQEKG